MEPELLIDAAYCILRSFRTREECMIPGRSFKSFYIENSVNVEFEDGSILIYNSAESVLQEFPKALASANYRKVISLGPGLLLIKELIHRIPAVFLPVLCSIKHLERYRRGLSDTWCCKLHESIANLLYEPTFQYIYNIREDVLFKASVELYGSRASLPTRQKMFARLCDSNMLTLTGARALVTKDFHEHTVSSYMNQYLDRFLEKMDPKLSFLIIVKMKISFFELREINSKENKWWWMHYLNSLKGFYRRFGDDTYTTFLNATITRESEESVTIRFYRGLLKRFLDCPVAFWPHLLTKLVEPLRLAGEVLPFDPYLAKVLFSDDDARQIFDVVCRKNSPQLIPFIKFPKDYIKYGLEKGFLPEIVKYDVFENARFKDLKELVQILMATKLNNLNELLDFKITDVFLPRAVEAEDFNFLNWIKHPYELSLDKWQEIVFKTDYLYKLTKKEDVKYLFSGLRLVPGEGIDLYVNLFLSSNDEHSVKDYIKLVFNPERSREFCVLFLHPSRTKLINQILSHANLSSLTLYQYNYDRNLPRNIRTILNNNVNCYNLDELFAFPLGGLLHESEFLCRALGKLFERLECQSVRWEFCEKATANFLIFMREAALTLVEVWELYQDGKEDEAKRHLYSFILNCTLD